MHFLKTGRNVEMINGMRKSFPVYKESETAVIFDTKRDIVGKEDVIKNVKSSSKGTKSYALEKHGAWFDEGQLEEI